MILLVNTVFNVSSKQAVARGDEQFQGVLFL